jgi:hypothetical protein
VVDRSDYKIETIVLESDVKTELNRHVVRGALGGASPALVVDLCGGDVPVSEEILDLARQPVK